MKKRLIALCLSFLMLSATTAVPALALENSIEADNAQQMLDEEFERRMEILYSSVYYQLEAQDALDYIDLWMELLTPGLRAAVYGDENNNIIQSRATFSGYTYGGVLFYNLNINPSVTAACSVTGLDVEDTEIYLLCQVAESFEFSLEDLIIDVGSTLLGTEIFANLLDVCELFMNISVLQDIEAAGGYSKIWCVSYNGGPVQTLVSGWHEYSDIELESGAYNIVSKKFDP